MTVINAQMLKYIDDILTPKDDETYITMVKIDIILIVTQN